MELTNRLRIVALIPLILSYLITIEAPFFWDTMHLASAQASWFYEGGMNNFLLPDHLDSGHPPLIGWLLAGMWKVAGKGLFQSHLMMLPFLVMIIWNIDQLLRHYFQEQAVYFQFLFYLNPYFLAQSMLVSPDILLLAGFFTTFHGLLKRLPWKVLAGSILLCLISMRGMACAAVLFLFSIFLTRQNTRQLLKQLCWFAPAGLAGICFLAFHFHSKGWIGYHPGSPWAASFEPVGAVGVLRNILVLLWRFADQGLLFLWLIPIVLLLIRYKERMMEKWTARTGELFVLFLLLFFLLVVPQLFYRQLLMHRYLLPVIWVLTMLFASITVDQHLRIKSYVQWGTLLMLSGYCWIYPDSLSKGWDVMPLHFPYYHHRAVMMKKMEISGIEPRETGAGFPYEMASSVIDLSADSRAFAAPDLEQNKYVLYSNISNDFSEEMQSILKSKWEVMAQSGTWPVRFILYKKP